MNSAAVKKSATEERLAAAEQKLADAVDALVTSQDWIRGMQFAAQFRSRSAGRIGVFEVREYPNPDQT